MLKDAVVRVAPITKLHAYSMIADLKIFPLLEEGLKQRYPQINFVNYDEFGSTHGGDEHAVIAG